MNKLIVFIGCCVVVFSSTIYASCSNNGWKNVTIDNKSDRYVSVAWCKRGVVHHLPGLLYDAGSDCGQDETTLSPGETKEFYCRTRGGGCRCLFQIGGGDVRVYSSYTIDK